MKSKHNRVIFLWALVITAAIQLPALAADYIFVPTVKGLDVVNCETGQVSEGARYSDYVLNASYSPDGRRYYLNALHSIFAVDVKTFKLVDTYKFSTDGSRVTISASAVSNDGRNLYLSCQITKKKQNIPKLNVLPPQFVIFDIEKKEMVQHYELPYGVHGIFPIRKDPDHAILFGLDVYKINLKTGKLEKIMAGIHAEKGQEQRSFIAMYTNNSPGDHQLFAAPYYAQSGLYYLILDMTTGEIRTLKSKEMGMPFSAALSPDKKYIYAGHDELVKVDAATGETVKAVYAARGSFTSVALSPDGKKVYIGAMGADVSIYDADTLKFETAILVGGDAMVFNRFSR
jgi:DNA-binding beta-propeller fold protein YncE